MAIEHVREPASKGVPMVGCSSDEKCTTSPALKNNIQSSKVIWQAVLELLAQQNDLVR
jgi:hypothetical protein